MRKRAVSFVLVLCLLAIGLPTVSAASSAEIAFCIDPVWADAGDFHDGLARVFDGKKWGYLNADGQLVIPCQWDLAMDFSEGLAAVATVAAGSSALEPDVQTWHLIDRQGKVLHTIGTHDAYAYETRAYLSGLSDGTFLAVSGSRQSAVLTSLRSGTLRTVCTTQSGSPFRGGYAIVSASADGSFDLPDALATLANALDPAAMPDMVIDSDGNVFWDSDWGMILSVENGLVVYHSRSAGLWGIDRLDGSQVVAPVISDLWYRYHNDVFTVFSGPYATLSIEGREYASDQNGKLYRFDAGSIGVYGEGLFPFNDGTAFGYCLPDGTVTIPAAFRNAEPFSCGVAVVATADGVHYIDKTGSILNQQPYQAAYAFSEELGRVRVNDLYGYVSLSGRPADAAGDLPDSWAADEVAAAYEHGLLPDAFCCSYRSNATRAELARLSVTLLTQLRGCTLDELVATETGRSLDDVLSAYPFPDTSDRYVLAAYALGIISGYPDGTFRPDGAVTRVEAAKMLTVTATLAGISRSGADVVFADDASIASWAKTYVSFVGTVGIMNGTGGNRFDPLGSYTREQAYLTMERIYRMAKSIA